LTQQHPLKAYDAVQLAVALHQNRFLLTVHHTLTFISGDRKLLAAAVAEELAIDNPFEHISPQDLAAASQ
jgi:cation transport ATPase